MKIKTSNTKTPVLSQVKNTITGDVYHTFSSWDKVNIDGVQFTRVVAGYTPNQPVAPRGKEVGNGRVLLVRSDSLKLVTTNIPYK